MKTELRTGASIEPSGVGKIRHAQRVLAKRQASWKINFPHHASLEHAFSKLPGGRLEGMAYALKACEKPGNERLKTVFERWEHLSRREQETVPLDKICRDVGVDPAEFFGEAVKFGIRYNTDLAGAVAAAVMPDVVRHVAKRAKGARGSNDSRLLFEATGLLPTKAGVIVNNLVSSRAQAVAESAASESGITLPAFDADTVDACDEQRQAVVTGDSEG